MRRKITVLIAVILAFVLAYQFIPADPSDQQLDRIKQKIANGSGEKVIAIEPKPSGVLFVDTQGEGTGLSASGHRYHLRKFFGRWRVVRVETWQN
jgi:hypothetical protein